MTLNKECLKLNTTAGGQRAVLAPYEAPYFDLMCQCHQDYDNRFNNLYVHHLPTRRPMPQNLCIGFEAQESYYQLAFLTPGRLPANAFIRNWN